MKNEHVLLENSGDRFEFPENCISETTIIFMTLSEQL
jgi:hypothetical protein